MKSNRSRFRLQAESSSNLPKIYQKSGVRWGFIIWFILLGFLRIGEAKNPGPEQEHFVLGTANPTGLLHKGNLVSTLPLGMWGLTETHLTDLGLRQFRRELQFNQGTFKYITNVVAPRLCSSSGAMGGKACGVGILSAHPCRSIPSDWDAETLGEARVYVGASYINQSWIKCGVLYGYSRISNNQVTLQKNDQLLEKLIRRIAFESQGPRMICGDFNHVHGSLPHTTQLLEAGFVEIQQYALQAWGKPIEVTCKGSTTKDFVWISRELIPWLREVHVDATWFADHSIVYGKFVSQNVPRSIPMWRKPHPLPWEECPETIPCSPLHVTGQDSDTQLREIIETMEIAVDRTLRDSNRGGLLLAQKGRCSVVKEFWCPDPLQPPKVGRTHDPQPKFMGENMVHVRWLRQLRRLNDLVRILSKPEEFSNRIDHVTNLWNSIKAAPGFSGGFRHAWLARTVASPGDPLTIPRNVPTLECARALRDSFSREFRALEKSLVKRRVEKAKSVRMADPHKVYQDVSKPRPLPVQTIVTKQSATVTWVSPEGDKCKYSPIDLDTVGALSTSRGLLSVLSHQPGEIELSPDQHVEQGDLLLQDKWIGDTESIFREFANLWTPLWSKHDNLSPAQWEDFAQHCIPLLPESQDSLRCNDISLDQWDQVVSSKKKRSATGPDGMSRQDLIRMPDECRVALVALINRIELGLPWPRTTMTGLISSLEKHDRAQTVKDYRPICVFSLIYRVWSSLRARECLRWLMRFIPDDLLGSCPNRQASDLWYTVASLVEFGNHFEERCCGALADLSKCFNNIPRIPVFLIAKKLGLPDRICIPWQRALIAMERRFCVNGAVSRAHTSSCGFPEGDPLSVVAMVLINISLDSYMKSQKPEVRCWTYVDDWQLTGQSYDTILDGMAEVKSFTEFLELPMDPGKAAFWGNHHQDRQGFRNAGQPVIHHGRNLGGHVSYGKLLTNYTIRARIQSQQTMWSWLRCSLAPVVQKTLVLAVVSWPRCLHGASATPLGQDNVNRLRTKAMQSLKVDHPGANPLIHLGCLCPPRTDPGFFLLRDTVLHFRRFCNPDVAFPVLDYLSECVPVHSRPGPCGVFLHRIQDVGWSWKGSGIVMDHELIPIHLFRTPVQTILARLTQAWWARIGAVVSQRKGFQGFENVDVQLTVAKLNEWSGDRRGLLQVVLNGTYYTRDRQFHSGLYEDKQCPWCRNPTMPVIDSVFHRHWCCPHFQSSRNEIEAEVFSCLSELPECSLNHAWCVKSPLEREFLHLLTELPDLSREFHPVVSSDGPLHLFTDGSCIYPTNQLLRLATWGVTLANLNASGGEEFWPIAQGPVPGLHQTVFRGEVWAAIAACRFALSHRSSFWLWCDNQQVVNFIKEVGNGSPPPTLNDKDHDLLGILFALITQARSSHLFEDIVKVRSHEDELTYSDAIERWAIRGNESADVAAARARQVYTSRFVAVWTTLCSHTERMVWLRDCIHAHVVRVGLQAVDEKSKVKNVGTVRSEGDGPPVVSTDDAMTRVTFDGFLDISEYQPSIHLTDFALEVVEWLRGLLSASDADLQWVTSYQLLVDFQNFSGRIGMSFNNRQWQEIEEWSIASAYDFPRIARWFAAYLKSIARDMQLPYEGIHQTPTSFSFRCWTRCLRLRISSARMLRVDKWWQTLGIVPIKKVGTSFTKIPVVARSFLNT